MNRIFEVLFAFISLALVFLATTVETWDPDLAEIQIINPDGPSPHFSLEIAISKEQRALGLMFRQDLSEDGGMIFVFPQSRISKMWMKDTLLSLDMLFVDEQGVVQDVKPDCSPKNENIISSRGSARFVIELKAGSSAKFGIRRGSRIDITEALATVVRLQAPPHAALSFIEGLHLLCSAALEQAPST